MFNTPEHNYTLFKIPYTKAYTTIFPYSAYYADCNSSKSNKINDKLPYTKNWPSIAITIFEQKLLYKWWKSHFHLSKIDGANVTLKKGWSLKLFLHGAKTISDTKVNERNISVP